MASVQLTFRTEDSKRDQLDLLAKNMDRDRSYMINEALDQYLDLHRWQIEQIRKGEEDIQAGRWLSHKQVRERLEKHIAKKKTA